MPIPLILAVAGLTSPPSPIAPSADEPFPAHRIVGNVYYVGSKSLASFLITTDAGHILINSGFEATVPLVKSSVESLGFRFEDVKVLLTSHAHGDHVGGTALVRRLTGARVMVMKGDDGTVRLGGKGEVPAGGEWPPSEIDRVLSDGDLVELGGMKLVARLTPGHTRGTTTWTFKATEKGRDYDVVVIGGSPPEPEDRLVGDPAYPGIADDYRTMFRVLESLPCDVPLGPHGNYFALEAKYARLQADSTINPYLDPERYRRAVPMAKKRFEDLLAKQQPARP